MCRSRLWKWTSLHRGLIGKPGVGSFTRYFERRVKEGSGNGMSLPVGDLRGGTWRGSSFTGDREGYVKEGCGNGRLLT